MIAEVYPIKRTSRSMRVFDYNIPNELFLKRGMVVDIPFRNKGLLGVVARIKDKPPRGIVLKDIIGARTKIELREEELSFFEWLARETAQSVSTVLFVSLPSLLKSPREKRVAKHHPNTIPTSEVNQVRKLVDGMSCRRSAFLRVPDLRRTSAVIAGFQMRNPKQKTIVFAPTVRDAELLSENLPVSMSPVTGERKGTSRFEDWTDIRAVNSGIIVGTKVLSLMLDPTISTIIIIRSGHKSHKQYERNPRFDVRDISAHIYDAWQTNLYHIDVIESTEDVHFFKPENIIEYNICPSTKIIDTGQERAVSSQSLIAYSTIESIRDSLDKGSRVLCLYNRKGYVRHLHCQNCQHRFLCVHCNTPLRVIDNTLNCPRCHVSEPIFISCPQCKSKNIYETRIGHQRVAEILSNIFDSASVQIVDAEKRSACTADILVSTNVFFERFVNPFSTLNISLVAVLDADAPLYSSTGNALDLTLYNLFQSRAVANYENATFLVQTESSSFHETALSAPTSMLLDELESRRTLFFPPINRFARVSFESDEPKNAQFSADSMLRNLSQECPNAIIHGPVFTKPGSWFILIGTGHVSFNSLIELFTTFPDRYIIDTNVKTI